MLLELIAALRGVARRPGFFALAILTLAIGIGANAALFSLLDAIYFRPLPLRDPGSLVEVTSTSPRAFGGLLSYLEYEELARSAPALEEVVATGTRGAILHLAGESHMLRVEYVSPNYFEALGLPMHLGAGLRPEDASTPQVVLNHHLWRERLGERRDVVGSAVQLNDTLFTVTGVTPPGFVSLDRIVRTDVWVMASQAPLVVPRLRAELSNPFQRWFEVYARVAPGARVEQVQAQLDALAKRWEEEAPDQYPESGLALRSLSATRRASVQQGVILLAFPGLVLLIACANVSNLLLARSEARRRELSIRAALGAGGAGLARLLFGESLLLSASGAALGLLLAWWTIDLFPALVPPAAVTYTLDARFDGRTLGFAALVLVASALLVALVPALRSSRPNLVAGLKGDPGSGAPLHARPQHVIVAVQVALGVVVLVAAGLVLRSLGYSLSLHPGFDREKELATFYVVPALRGYDSAATYRFLEACRERLAALPSARRASYAIRLPAQGNEAGWAKDVVVPGKEPPPGRDAFRIRYTMVGPDYFDVIGTHILLGRGIDAADRPEGEPVAVISETMARRLFAGEDPVGKTILVGGAEPVARRIVGVAEDVTISDLYEEPEMYVYLPYAQDRQGFGLLLVELDGDAEALLEAGRAAIASLDPEVPLLDSGSLEGHMRMVLFEERRDAGIAVSVGLLAVLLTGVGVYGLVAVVAACRTREIGIRSVLGARRGDIVRLVVGRGLRLASAGAAAGLFAAFALSRLLAGRLHGVGALDPLAFAGGAGIVLSVALLASLVPAIRAARLDPARTVRQS